MNALIRMYRNVLFPVFYVNGIYFFISIMPHFSSWTGSLTCKTTVPACSFYSSGSSDLLNITAQHLASIDTTPLLSHMDH